jgi:hypothetical protein
MPALHLATFTCDVTPPLGHPLCGGWIKPALAIDDPLRLLGVVLLGTGRPVVLCAVDWCGIRNDAHLAWRKALADATHTVMENVALQAVHPHNAPFADIQAEKLIAATEKPNPSLDLEFFDRAVNKSADAARAAPEKTRAFTHVGLGQARVEKVASNRRILGDDGKVKAIRFSATKDPKVRDEPEGLIDPWLKTVSFWDGTEPLVAMHYYATHPMSYYGDGKVTSDFCGLARQKRQDDDPKVFQIYFNGCAGNITVGKYNDGSPENRPILRDRVFEGMKAAWKTTERQPIRDFAWRIEPVKLPPRKEESFGEEQSRKALEDAKLTPARRNNAAFQLAWLKRIDRPIDCTCLHLGKAAILNLPGEPFIEYQLKAQELGKDLFVCTAGYGDGGPGYIPTDKGFEEGGYEPTVALAGPGQGLMTGAITRLLKT